MRKLIHVLVTSLFATLPLSGCSSPDEGPCGVTYDPAVVPTSDETAVPEATGDPSGLCRNHMRLIATMEAMFHGMYGKYGTLEDLAEGGLGPIPTTCPGCGFEYSVELDSQNYTLTCPRPTYPTHGSVVDGIYSWQ